MYQVTVSVTDGELSAEQAISITVTDANEMPILSSSSNITITENNLFVTKVEFIDPENDEINYKLINQYDSEFFELTSLLVKCIS